MTIEVSTFFPFLKVETVLSTTDGDDDGVDGANCNQLVRSIRMEILFCAKNKNVYTTLKCITQQKEQYTMRCVMRVGNATAVTEL